MHTIRETHKDYRRSLPLLADALTLPFTILADVLQRASDRRQYAQLLKMSDYELRDIGLQRHDIQREMMKPLWRE